MVSEFLQPSTHRSAIWQINTTHCIYLQTKHNYIVFTIYVLNSLEKRLTKSHETSFFWTWHSKYTCSLNSYLLQTHWNTQHNLAPYFKALLCPWLVACCQRLDRAHAEMPRVYCWASNWMPSFAIPSMSWKIAMSLPFSARCSWTSNINQVRKTLECK